MSANEIWDAAGRVRDATAGMETDRRGHACAIAMTGFMLAEGATDAQISEWMDRLKQFSIELAATWRLQRCAEHGGECSGRH